MDCGLKGTEALYKVGPRMPNDWNNEHVKPLCQVEANKMPKTI